MAQHLFSIPTRIIKIPKKQIFSNIGCSWQPAGNLWDYFCYVKTFYKIHQLFVILSSCKLVYKRAAFKHSWQRSDESNTSYIRITFNPSRSKYRWQVCAFTVIKWRAVELNIKWFQQNCAKELMMHILQERFDLSSPNFKRRVTSPSEIDPISSPIFLLKILNRLL